MRFLSPYTDIFWYFFWCRRVLPYRLDVHNNVLVRTKNRAFCILTRLRAMLLPRLVGSVPQKRRWSEVVKKKSLWCRQLRQHVRKLSHLKLNLVFPSPYLPISLSIFPSLQISFSLFSLFLSSLSLFLNPKNTRAQTHKMTKGASPSPRTRMRATAASRHVARNLLRQARRNDESLLLSQSFQFSVFSSTLHIFKYRNKVVDRSEKLIYDDSMRWPRAANPGRRDLWA